MKSNELKQGVKVEKEHTSDPKEAEKIAQDHLKEDPSYYSKLKVSGLADELEDTEQEKKVKKLLDSYHQIAKVRLGKQPSIEDVISLMADDLKKRSSDEIAESLDKNSQKDAVDFDADMEKAEDSEESQGADIPSILMHTIYYGMSKGENGEKNPDESNILFYEDPDGLVYDCKNTIWHFQRPEMLDHLPSRDMQNNKTDILHAILHGIVDEDNFSLLSGAGMIDSSVAEIYKKMKEKLDKTNGIGEISPAPPTPPAPGSVMAMSEDEPDEELEKSDEDFESESYENDLDDIYDAYLSDNDSSEMIDEPEQVEIKDEDLAREDFLAVKSVFEQIIDGAFSDPDGELSAKIRKIVREELKKM